MQVKKKIDISLLVIGILTAVTVLMMFINANDTRTEIISKLERGNRYLNEMEYERAIAEYEAILEIEPDNRKALEGLMQAACGKQDIELFVETIEHFAEVVLPDDETETPDDMSLQIFANARDGFNDTEGYATFISEIKKKNKSEEMQTLCNQSIQECVAEYIVEEKYQEAQDLLLGIGDNLTEEQKQLLEKLLLKCSELAWKDRDFTTSMDYLKQYIDNGGNLNELNTVIERVVEDYVLECIKLQEYDDAIEMIEWAQNIVDSTILVDRREEVLDMKETDTTLQDMIETLNTAFDSEDIETIQAQMLSDEFKECTAKISNVLYCNSLKGMGKPTGAGTAIYNHYGDIYVYYGDFIEGRREGHGLWYYTRDDGTVDKYDLMWSGNMPNGEGTLDSYGTMTGYDYGGRVTGTQKTHDLDSFVVDDGVINGEYIQKGEVLDNHLKDYVFTMNYVKGYAKRIEVGDYPSEICRYIGEIPLSAYYEKDGWYAWKEWTNRFMAIPGLNIAGYNFTIDNKVLTLKTEN